MASKVLSLLLLAVVCYRPDLHFYVLDLLTNQTVVFPWIPIAIARGSPSLSGRCLGVPMQSGVGYLYSVTLHGLAVGMVNGNS